MVIHTEGSISADLLCNSHRKLALQLLKRHDSTRHVDDVIDDVFPRCPSVDLNQRTVYNHMDAVMMCCD